MRTNFHEFHESAGVRENEIAKICMHAVVAACQNEYEQ